jgi:hypothetical protein
MIGLLIAAAGASLTGCSGTAQAGPAAEAPTTAPSETEVPGVTRASIQDRQSVAETMKSATDYYATTAWNLTELCSKYPSMEARSKDSNYSTLLDATQIDKITAADEKIIPLIFGKSMDDYNIWMDWKDKVTSLTTDLSFWGAGTILDQDLKAKAAKDLADARADIEKFRS